MTPPARTPTLIRAMAAVAGTPPKNGIAINKRANAMMKSNTPDRIADKGIVSRGK